jgi:hypothetical protein
MALDDNPHATSTFGYMAILEHPEQGFFGGYLIVCAAGRPLEFHCSAPVKPSRAQEILYGPTLRPYLLGHQIAGSLLANAKLQPSLMLTNEADIIATQSLSQTPWVLLTDLRPAGLDPVSLDSPRLFQHAGYHCELASVAVHDLDRVQSMLAMLSRGVDLAEPFERIQLAICEAQRIGESELETDAHAA